MRGLSRFFILILCGLVVTVLPVAAQFTDPHEGKLGQDCESCHTLDGWKPSTFTVARHQETVFPLKGRHEQVECETCHTDKFFKGTPTDCYDCHQTTDLQQGHRGQLGQDCTRCHTEKDWAKPTFDRESHQQTKFPLEGKHQEVECVKCHVERNYRIERTDCIDCHVEDEARVHRGELEKDCTLCHTVDGWKPSTYDHAERTIRHVEKSRTRRWLAWILPEFLSPKDRVYEYRYELVGKHAEAACQDCHAGNRFRNTSTECATCHAEDDSHGGRLGQECSRCHQSTDWQPASFDHSTIGFDLVGQHARVPCESCHADQQYHEIPSECQQCHATNVAHAQDTTNECQLCHSAWGWQIISFEHNALRFLLEGKHAQVGCYDCHSEQSFRGLNDDCRQCHQDPHEGDFGSECTVCHTPTTWATSTSNHDATGFPLIGKHRGLDCRNCHQPETYKGLRPNCSFCHRQDSPPDHFGPNCEDCHSSNGWTPANLANFDHTAFPIDQGKHQGLSCNRCHTVPSDFSTFSCISGGCHPQARTDDKHRGEVRNYVYESNACYRCHPQGRGEGD